MRRTLLLLLLVAAPASAATDRQTRTFLPSAADDPLAPGRPGAPPTEIPFEDFELAVFENRFPSLTPSKAPAKLSAWASGPARSCNRSSR